MSIQIKVQLVDVHQIGLRVFLQCKIESSVGIWHEI